MRRLQKLQHWMVVGTFVSELVFCSCRGSQPAKNAGQEKPLRADAVARAESAQERSCREFVQGFYDWYFESLDTDNAKRNSVPTFSKVWHKKPPVLTFQLSQMLEEDNEAQAKSPGYIAGLDFDPFLDAQDWEGRYKVHSAAVMDNNCRASVWGMDSGKKREMVRPELMNTGASWVFANFYYPANAGSGDRNLIQILQELRESRIQVTK